MDTDRGFFLFCATVLLIGVVSVGAMVVPRAIEDSKIPVYSVNY